MPTPRTGCLLVIALLYAAPASAEFWILSHSYSNGLQGPAHAVESRDGSSRVTEADAYSQAAEECTTYPEVVAVSIRAGAQDQANVLSCEQLIEMLGGDQNSRGVEQEEEEEDYPAAPTASRPDE